MKIRLFTVIIYSLFLLSLGMYYDTYYIQDVDPRIKPYYDEVLNIIKSKCNDDQYKHEGFKIKLGKVVDDNETVGICTTYIYSNKFNIDLDEQYWNNVNDLTRFHLFLHEAAHCFLDIDHVEDNKHFMYYRLEYISKEELYKQFNEILEDKCK